MLQALQRVFNALMEMTVPGVPGLKVF